MRAIPKLIDRLTLNLISLTNVSRIDIQNQKWVHLKLKIQCIFMHEDSPLSFLFFDVNLTEGMIS